MTRIRARRLVEVSALLFCFVTVAAVVIIRPERLPFIQEVDRYEWSVATYVDVDPLVGLHTIDPSGLVSHEDIGDLDAIGVADPFVVAVDDTFYLFVEILIADPAFPFGERGVLGWFDSTDGVDWRFGDTILDDVPYHLSYPQIIESAGEVYLLPESGATGETRLYRAIDFPSNWVDTGVILEGNWSDPTVYEVPDGWLLLASGVTAGGTTEDLEVFEAPELSGPWQLHRDSPVISQDASRARPAGPIVALGGRVYRSAQQNEQRYGEAVRLFEVVVANRTEFRLGNEAIVVGQATNDGWNSGGMHHLATASNGERTVVASDGYQIVAKREFGFAATTTGLIAALVVLAALGLRSELLRRRASILVGLWAVWEIVSAVRLLRNIVRDPVTWDFPSFYAAARAAWSGRDFYSDDVLREVSLQEFGPLPTGWLSEVGYWYPPPSMLPLAPLGSMSPRVSLIVFCLALASALAVTAWLLVRWAAKGPSSSDSLRMVAPLALLLSMPVTDLALQVTQISILAALAALVAQRYSASPWAGVALAVGALFKPVLFIPLLFIVVAGGWRTIRAAVGVTAATWAAAWLVFGTSRIEAFVSGGPSERPIELSMNPVIQSLNGVLRRMLDQPPDGPGLVSLVVHWPTIVASALVCFVTALAFLRSSSAAIDQRAVFAAGILASLLIYPNTLTTTIVIAVPVLLVVVGDALSGAPSRRLAILLTVAGFALGTSHFSPEPIVGVIAAWFGLVVTTLLWPTNEPVDEMPAVAEGFGLTAYETAHQTASGRSFSGADQIS